MHKSALILTNISKGKNFGGIIRTADALGIAEIIIVGRKRYASYGNFGTNNRQRQQHFFTSEDAVQYLHDHHYNIAGIEISQDALPVETHPFYGNTAFLIGNEGTGLTDQQKKCCDYLVYIKQFGQGASLNVNVATGIVLHHFALWASYKENPIDNGKFISVA